MRKLQNYRRLLLGLTVAMASCLLSAETSYADKGGKGKPGGDPPEPPPVLYALQRFAMPADYMGYTAIVREVNDVGELAGYYTDVGGVQPFYFDSYSGKTVATNLNDLEFDKGPDPVGRPDLDYRIPEGWYLGGATGINNWGDISGSMKKVGDPDQMRGCVIELRPNPLDSTVKPRLHLIPDEAWSKTYATRINDAGIVLGRGDEVTSYVYRVPLHGLHGLPGDSPVQVIPFPFDAWYDNAVLTNPVNGGASLVKADISITNEILTYDVDYVDSGNPSFTDVSAFNISIVDGFNDLGDFCGRLTTGRKNRTTWKGFWFDGSLNESSDMEISFALNNDGDVIGSSPGRRAILHHPEHGSISIDDTIVANDAEQTIWDNSSQFIPTLSERDATGEREAPEFPFVAGMIRRNDTSFNFFYDGYVLIPKAVP